MRRAMSQETLVMAAMGLDFGLDEVRQRSSFRSSDIRTHLDFAAHFPLPFTVWSIDVC